MRKTLLALILASLAWVSPAGAAVTERPWPPASGPGHLFVHYGEEHWDDEDGLTLLPAVIEQALRYRPAFVTMSGDKASDGTTEILTRWREIMEAYDRAGIPYFAGVGNHDGRQPTPEQITAVAPGSTPSRDITEYREVFKGRPFPFGDAKPYAGFEPSERPPNDPDGASSHYFFDFGNIRYVFVDSSCYGIVNCDPFQANPYPDVYGASDSYDFLDRVIGEAKRQGKVVFVDTHVPTRDPRDQSHSPTGQRNHVMGKGISPDNTDLEVAMERLRVDGVFTGHIKGQFLYRGRGGVPYYIDGGAGGELYTEGPVGTDHGYWHGFRLVRVDGGQITTDTVPIFVPGGIRIEGADSVRPGKRSLYTAFGKQPVFHDPAKVEALELRDPDPIRPVEDGDVGSLAGLMRGGGWSVVPVALLLLGGLMLTLRMVARPRRRALLAACAATGAGMAGMAAMSAAQQSTPTTTPLESLPEPARIFATSDPLVMAPVASESDDPRRDPRTQTEDGLFEAQCPGAAKVRVTAGFETTARRIVVPSRPGQRIVRDARVIRPRGLRPGTRRLVARVKLIQPAIVRVRIRRGGRTLRTLRRACVLPGRPGSRVAWDGRVKRRGKLRPARPGRYRVELLVRSDRKPVKRSRVVRLLPRRG